MKTEHVIPVNRVSKSLLIVNALVAIFYLMWWINVAHIGNIYLYGLLVIGEIYHVFMSFALWHTIWPKNPQRVDYDRKYSRSVDVFITVAGEPVSIVRRTAIAARSMSYPEYKVFLLNDGYVAKKKNWKAIEKLANDVGISCITRKISGGAKAGNINYALRKTKGEFVVIFDADMVPHKNFLEKVMPYFADQRVGFVQTPQYYSNNDLNEVTRGSWQQQEFFFGPIMVGKANKNAAIICGTNFAIRRKALLEVGGMREDNIAEDFLTSLGIYQKGWKARYVPIVLAEGLAPEDLLSYYKQQLRWARGSVEVLFKENLLFKKGLSFAQKLEYITSSLYYTNGLIVLIDMLMPLIYLYVGITPVASTTTSFALFFVPFMFLNLYTLYVASNENLSFRAISYSFSSFTVQLQALASIITGRKMGFVVTPKKGETGNFLFLAYPHIAYILASILGSAIALRREGPNPSVAANMAWAAFNAILFTPYIFAASGRELQETEINIEKI